MSDTPRIISIANSKGGVGKSIVTIMLAVALARKKGKKIIILDCDNQGSIADMYNTEIEIRGNDVVPAVEVEEITPRRVQTFIRRFGEGYDIIFIDIPRMTDNKKDSATVMLLYDCDSVLMPIVGSEVDVLSSLDFLAVVKEAADYKKEVGEDFQYYGFINRRNLRKYNEEAENIMKREGLKMFNNSLKDLRIFTEPSFFSAILESAEGERRFSNFFNEFCRKFKIK